ncbi:hypothetical protein [Terrisporobacter vanillatitrophus]|uniref:hypothetical protein n=1 Tax=Terrisporobacter vanillatitrophus TaxID=3058402 RepID=UPI003EBF90DC
MNNLLLILAMMLLSNGNVSLFDNKNKSNKPAEESTKVEVIEPSTKSNQNKRSGSTVRKVKKIKKKTRSKDPNRERKNDPIKNILKFDMVDVNKGINLMDLSEEDLDRGMEIITRTKKYMNKEERNILIKLESVLDLVKGIKKLNHINILSEEDESDFFRSMDEEDKKNMMIKEIIEVFPEKKKQSVEKALEMKKMIDLFAELFLPDGEEGGGFSLSSLADINNLGSISNLKLLGSLLRSLDDDDDDEEEEEKEYEYVEVDEDDMEDVEDENTAYDYDEYLKVNKAMTNNKKYSKSKSKKNRNKRKKQM